ncbi:outer dynein arm-docking complex subunit 4 [Pholidichthys leucotaenia]
MPNNDEELDGETSKGMFSTLLADGNWLYLKGEYKKALESFTAAMKLKPGDKFCFVGLSKCYLKLGQPENALKQAEASLKGDRLFFEGLYQKAEALYYMGEFEFALVFYHRGQKIRPQKQEFRLGIQKAQEAIENSLCSPFLKLDMSGDLSFLKKDEEHKQPITAIQNLTREKKTLKTPKTPKREKTNRQLLGEFYSDKKYLESLMKDKDLLKGKTRSGEALQDVVQSYITYLDTCTEFWNQERPIQGRQQSARQKCRKAHHEAPANPTEFLLNSLDQIDAELACGNTEGSLRKAEEVLKMVQQWSEREVPNKTEMLGSLHSCMGNALMEVGDLDKALEHHQRDLALAEQCKLLEAKSRALCNIGRVHEQMGQFEQAAEIWEKKIPLVCSSLEKTWLFHEIGCCYLELSRHNEARDYGIRSATAAEEIGDDKWQINANVLVAQSELKLGNFESCVSYFERALTHARLVEDDSAVDAIQQALDEAKQRLPQ